MKFRVFERHGVFRLQAKTGKLGGWKFVTGSDGVAPMEFTNATDVSVYVKQALKDAEPWTPYRGAILA